MTELRYDPVFDRWVCVAENRMARPFEFRQKVNRQDGLDCPFCAGNEPQTPAAIAEYGSDGQVLSDRSRDWLVRVIPNKYPAFDAAVERPLNRLTASIPTYDPPGGQQEVIVLSPRHIASLAELRDRELSVGFEVFQNRVREYEEMADIKHVCLFMNCRPQAGASIEHVHFQLIGAPICTSQVRQQFERIGSRNGASGQSIWQQQVEFELSHDQRMLEKKDPFLTFCPFASSHAFQIRIAPTDQTGRFSQLSPALRDELAGLCRRWIRCVEKCLDGPAYNIVFYFPPQGQGHLPWFIDVIPRLSQVAGFELGTDCWVNPTSPETAAARLLDQNG